MKICKIKGCDNKHHAQGLCQKHYDKIQRKRYYQNNKEHCAKYQKQYRKDNIKHYVKQKRQYRQTPAGKAVIRADNHKRRLLTKDLTTKTVQRVYEDNIKLFGTLTCILCEKPIKFGKDSLEHLTPLSRGGSNDFSNLGVAHAKCNSKKHVMTLKEWFARK